MFAPVCIRCYGYTVATVTQIQECLQKKEHHISLPAVPHDQEDAELDQLQWKVRTIARKGCGSQ